MHSSASRDDDVLGEDLTPQPRRRQIVSGGIGRAGSSESDSGSGGVGDGADCGVDWGARIGKDALSDTSIGLGGGINVSSVVGFGGAGVSSTVECLPVVHGGMDKNSSKVRTRGLQQFQPASVELV